jgi:hypothetical protein
MAILCLICPKLSGFRKLIIIATGRRCQQVNTHINHSYLIPAEDLFISALSVDPALFGAIICNKDRDSYCLKGCRQDLRTSLRQVYGWKGWRIRGLSWGNPCCEVSPDEKIF